MHVNCVLCWRLAIFTPYTRATYTTDYACSMIDSDCHSTPAWCLLTHHIKNSTVTPSFPGIVWHQSMMRHIIIFNQQLWATLAQDASGPPCAHYPLAYRKAKQNGSLWVRKVTCHWKLARPPFGSRRCHLALARPQDLFSSHLQMGRWGVMRAGLSLLPLCVPFKPQTIKEHTAGEVALANTTRKASTIHHHKLIGRMVYIVNEHKVHKKSDFRGSTGHDPWPGPASKEADEYLFFLNRLSMKAAAATQRTNNNGWRERGCQSILS